MKRDLSVIEKYFDLNDRQRERMTALKDIYARWNARINLISRKDFDFFYERHVLHSLAIAKFIRFLPDSGILDVGTGGGFPGIPLAVFFEDVRFHLIDSIGKKIRAVGEIARELQLENVTWEQTRVENHRKKYDFVVSRAVTRMDKFVQWTGKNIKSESRHNIPNGIIYLKGGDLTGELAAFPQAKVISVSNFFNEAFFETKKIVYLPYAVMTTKKK